MEEIEKLISYAHDARLVNVSESVLYPMLERMKASAISNIITKFDSGKSDFLAEAAQLSLLDKQIRQLKRLQQKGNEAYEKLNKGEAP